MSLSSVVTSPTLTLEALPSSPLYASQQGAGQSAEQAALTGWQLSPTPYGLSSSLKNKLAQLGPALWQFQLACDQLYRDSLAGKRKVPEWISALLNIGKPDALVQFAAMKRFKSHVPVVIRPDVLLTGTSHEADDFVITELDSVPGGLGFTSALNQAYRNSGCAVLEAEQGGLPMAWWRAITQTHGGENAPNVAVVLSDEAADYRLEMQWLVDSLAEQGCAIALVHPRQVELHGERLCWRDDDGALMPIDIVYRFFELFDLPNIPNGELIQFAVKKGWVQCTPPYKPHLEEKLWLVLLHHPALQPYWQGLMDAETLTLLKAHVPEGWVLNPEPVPMHAIIPGLTVGGQPVQQFMQLAEASQKERQLVIKPSGFSPLAWGSRGVVIGHDMKADDWAEALESALGLYAESPHVLQRFHKPARHAVERLDVATQSAVPMDARTRLCPYYLATGGELTLGGVLATHCPANKKIIHGMVDAIMAPCGH